MSEIQCELLRVLKAALKQTSCDGDLCLYTWHDDARRLISEAEAGDASFSQTEEDKSSMATAPGNLDLAAQEILKPHWPSVRNMDESEARQKEVERIIAILKRLRETGAAGQLSALREQLERALPQIRRAAAMLPMLADRDPQGRKTIDDFADQLNETRIELEQALAAAAPKPLDPWDEKHTVKPENPEQPHSQEWLDGYAQGCSDCLGAPKLAPACEAPLCGKLIISKYCLKPAGHDDGCRWTLEMEAALAASVPPPRL